MSLHDALLGVPGPARVEASAGAAHGTRLAQPRPPVSGATSRGPFPCRRAPCRVVRRGLRSDVIPEHQLRRIGVEVDLPVEPVVGRVAADVVPQQRDRNDQRQQSTPVGFDDFEQLLLVVGVEMVLDEAHRVMEHVRVPPPFDHLAEDLHEPLLQVALVEQVPLQLVLGS